VSQSPRPPKYRHYKPKNLAVVRLNGRGRFTYSYDKNDQVIRLDAPAAQTTTFTYDPAGRPETELGAAGITTTYSYDSADSLTGVHSSNSSGQELVRLTYTYDSVGNRNTAVDLAGVRSTWTYDPTYQLIREQQGGSPLIDTTFTYDPAGNRQIREDSSERTTYTYDGADRLLTSRDSAGVTTYTYDADGNRTLSEAPTGRTTFSWDAQNRLTRYENGAAAVDYAYNAFDQRVKRTTSSITQKYVFDFDRILARLNAAGQTDRLAVVTNEEYGRLLTEQTTSGSEHHLYDALGSTVSLAGDGGSITDTYRYRAFGSPLLHTGSSDSPYTFVGAWGYDYDADSGLYLVRRRWLDPDLGTWLSSDPIDVLVGDPNRYRYAFNSPIGLIDPSGELVFLAGLLWSATKGALVSGGINALLAWLCGRNPWTAFKAGLLPGALGGAFGFILGPIFGALGSRVGGGLTSGVTDVAIQWLFNDGEVDLRQTAAATIIGTWAGKQGLHERQRADAFRSGNVRVTQFFDPRRGSFGPGARHALASPPNRGLDRVFDGPWFASPTMRTHISPFPASRQTWWRRLLTGRWRERNYVEFDVPAGELNRIGGTKAILGRYQRFVRGRVPLSNPSFGKLPPNYGGYIAFGGAAAGGIIGGAILIHRWLTDG